MKKRLFFSILFISTCFTYGSEYLNCFNRKMGLDNFITSREIQRELDILCPSLYEESLEYQDNRDPLPFVLYFSDLKEVDIFDDKYICFKGVIDQKIKEIEECFDEIDFFQVHFNEIQNQAVIEYYFSDGYLSEKIDFND